MQRDSSTYCDEPEDEEDYAAWLATFDLAARRPDIDALIASNTFMAELQVGAEDGREGGRVRGTKGRKEGGSACCS